MSNLTQAQQHELIKSVFKLTPRALSIMVASMAPPREKHCLYRTFGPKQFTFMPRGKRVIDLLDIFPSEERDYLPSPFSRPCDPAMPIILQDFELGTLCSLSPGYIKRSFKVGICDDDLEKLLLRELPNIPWNISDMSDEEKMSAHIFAAARQNKGEVTETKVRSWNHSGMYGAFYNSGQGIDKADELITLDRHKKLAVCLSGDGFSNKNSSFGKTLEQLIRHYKNVNKSRCRVDNIVIDQWTADLIELMVEYQECGKCWNYDPNVVGLSQRFDHNGLKSNDPLAERGLTPFPYTNPRLRGVRIWVCDELEKTEIFEEVDGEMVGTNEYHMTPVLPQGSMMFLDSTKLASTALRGNIHNLKVRGALDEWSETRMDCHGECLEYIYHTSPMDFVGRVNAVMMVYIDPVNCPPPCDCWEMECDPTGGKAVAEGLNPLLKLSGGGDDVNKALADVVEKLKAQQLIIDEMKAAEVQRVEAQIDVVNQVASKKPEAQAKAAAEAVKANNRKEGGK